ncbi:hypothetical protein VTN02DRAFT_4025 [Thermoascus thermophilus]
MPMFLPALLRTAENPNTDVRVMISTSFGFRNHPKGGIIFEDLKTVQDFGPFGAWVRYGQSKLVKALYAVLSMSVSHALMNFKKP